MFFMVRVSKPSLFLQVCCLPVPPCFDDCHDGLFLVLCPSWPGSIMVTPWTLLVVPRGSSSLFLVVPPRVVLSLWSLPWSFLVVPPGPCALSLSLSFSLYLPPVSLCSSSLRYPSHVYTVVVDLFAIYLLSHSTYSARNTFLTPLHHIFLNF